MWTTWAHDVAVGRAVGTGTVPVDAGAIGTDEGADADAGGADADSDPSTQAPTIVRRTATAAGIANARDSLMGA